MQANAVFIPFGVRAAAVYADSFSKQRFQDKVCQTVKLSLYWFPFLCLSLFPFLCLSVPFSVSVGRGKVPMAGYHFFQKRKTGRRLSMFWDQRLMWNLTLVCYHGTCSWCLFLIWFSWLWASYGNFDGIYDRASCVAKIFPRGNRNRSWRCLGDKV